MASAVAFNAIHGVVYSMVCKCKPSRFKVKACDYSSGLEVGDSSIRVVVNEKETNLKLIVEGGNGSWKAGINLGLDKAEERKEEGKLGGGDGEELKVLYDDGYGLNTVKDYLYAARDVIKPDGGPPRWFCPVDCGRPVKDSPTLFFLPGN